MSNIAFRARPLSTAFIGESADKLRDFLGLGEVHYFPVAEVLELLLPKVLDGFVFRVGTLEELGADHGQTKPDEFEICLREDVYEGVVLGAGRDRSTGCHEIGHLVLHNSRYLSRRIGDQSIKTFEDPEWQASCFGGCLLMPEKFVRRCTSVQMMMEIFGVTADAAQHRLKQLKMTMGNAA
jgi:hypothetical protein